MRNKRYQKKLDNLSEKGKLIVKVLTDFNEGLYPSDIAQFYDWDFWETMQLCLKLGKKGILKSGEN